MDYAVEKCIDADGNKRCSTPFLVRSDVCYQIEWSTEGTISHTTVEVRDAGSDEMVYYRDTNGEWTPEKGEVCFLLRRYHEEVRLTFGVLQLVYLDFKPKVWKTGNDTVEYEVKTCEK